MRDLNFAIKNLCSQHRQGSFGTQDARRRSLDLMATQLHELGYRNIKGPHTLKPKHVHALVEHWKATDLSAHTMKNRMAHLRWLAHHADNPNLVRADNDHYGIERRQYLTNENRALEFDADRIAGIEDPHVRLSAELQAAFGLRREEAMKFVPVYADQGDHIRLKGSWTKGGKPREVPVRTAEQRDLLDRTRALARNSSMIPAHKSYIQHVKVFERHMERVGLGRTHGARHLYAQERYRELTGWTCPATGGPRRPALTPDQRELDHQARLQVSRELGHEREAITTVYLGR